jgi:hypothetical protein
MRTLVLQFQFLERIALQQYNQELVIFSISIFGARPALIALLLTVLDGWGFSHKIFLRLRRFQSTSTSEDPQNINYCRISRASNSK